MGEPRAAEGPTIIGRYALFGEIAVGGMASVHFARLIGPVGFARTVAIKRLHPQFARDPEFVAMFLDEARLAARIRHPNVVPTLDVVALEREAFLVMDYVPGESLAKLIRAARATEKPIPLEIVSSIMCGVLHGLHAAHEATDEHGKPLAIVHRDVSPQNVLVGVDGVPRVLDFGVAKAAGRTYTTRSGQLKGKIPYMAPEQLRSNTVDRRTDIYAAGIVLWETLVLKRLFTGDNEASTMANALEHVVEPPSKRAPSVPAAVDAIVMRALERDPAKRFESALEMALALEEAVPVASPTRVKAWVNSLAAAPLAERAKSVAEIESHSGAFAPLSTRVDTPKPRDGSQVSSISVSSTSSPHGVPSKARTRATIAGALVLVAGVVALAFVIRARAQASVATHTATVAPSQSQVTQPSIPPPSTESSAQTTVAPTPSASIAKPRPHVASTAAIVAAAVSTEQARPAASASAQPCAVTSFVDESGIKHFVRECK